MNNPHGRPPLSRREKFALTVASIVILLVSGAVATYMMKNRPRPERRQHSPSAQIVSVRELAPTSRRVTIPIMGSVVPAVEVDLKSRTAGEVIWVHPGFEEGGIVREGQDLVKLDPEDYQLALTAKKAKLQSALYDLKAEQGQQEIARREWELLGLDQDASQLDRELALRQPQLAAFQANLEAAQAEVRQAQLDLQRTVIKAPFNAIIRSKGVDIGSQVTVQNTLAHLVGSDSFFIEALIPLDRLGWVHIPEGPKDPGSSALVKSGTGRSLPGRIYKLLGDLEPEGRLARVLIEVRDPLDLEKQNGERRPLLLGDYVRAEIDGRIVENVFPIERQYLKDGNMVYLADFDDRLQIKKIKAIWSGAEHVLARGLTRGDRLIVSDVPAPVVGMKLRVNNNEDLPDTETRRRGDTE